MNLGLKGIFFELDHCLFFFNLCKPRTDFSCPMPLEYGIDTQLDRFLSRIVAFCEKEQDFILSCSRVKVNEDTGRHLAANEEGAHLGVIFTHSVGREVDTEALGDVNEKGWAETGILNIFLVYQILSIEY